MLILLKSVVVVFTSKMSLERRGGCGRNVECTVWPRKPQNCCV